MEGWKEREMLDTQGKAGHVTKAVYVENGCRDEKAGHGKRGWTRRERSEVGRSIGKGGRILKEKGTG